MDEMEFILVSLPSINIPHERRHPAELVKATMLNSDGGALCIVFNGGPLGMAPTTQTPGGCGRS